MSTSAEEYPSGCDTAGGYDGPGREYSSGCGTIIIN